MGQVCAVSGHFEFSLVSKDCKETGDAAFVVEDSRLNDQCPLDLLWTCMQGSKEPEMFICRFICIYYYAYCAFQRV